MTELKPCPFCGCPDIDINLELTPNLHITLICGNKTSFDKPCGLVYIFEILSDDFHMLLNEIERLYRCWNTRE